MSKTYAPRRSTGQWQILVDQWQQSGQSAKQFCREQKLAYASFCQWRRRLAQTNEFATDSKQGPREPSFIDLSSIGPSPCSGWHIVLSLGNGVIVWYLVTGAVFFAAILAWGIFAAYLVLGYFQLRVPLLDIDRNSIRVCNLFHTGLRAYDRSEDFNATLEGDRLSICAEDFSVVVRLNGMSARQKVVSADEIERFTTNNDPAH